MISEDRAGHTMVIRLDEPASCETAFYKCGDVRKGGDPQPPELWFGVICEMEELGNNTFKVKTVLGKYWPSAGEQDVYLWWTSCEGEPACGK